MDLQFYMVIEDFKGTETTFGCNYTDYCDSLHRHSVVVVNLVCVRLCGFDIVRDLIVLSRWVSNVEFENSAIRLGETHIHHEMLTWKERELYFGIF